LGKEDFLGQRKEKLAALSFARRTDVGRVLAHVVRQD
jgi:hypothetical protein